MINLRKNYFKNINLLTNLYNENSKIYKNITSRNGNEKISCLKHLNEFIDSYKHGIMKCYLDNTNFCNILKEFKGEYERISEPQVTSEKCNYRV